MSRAALVALLAGMLALAGCRPLYLPPVPASIERESRLILGSETALSVEARRLRVALVLVQVPTDGWLSVQWFDPGGRQVAADSTWVTPDDAGVRRDLFAPPEVIATPGRWWAVVSFEGELLRQLFVVVGA